VIANFRFSRSETVRMAGLYSFIVSLHFLGWGLYVHYASAYRSLVGLGLVAYRFGLRHAFDTASEVGMLA